MANDGHESLSSKGRLKTVAATAVVLLLLLVGFWPWFETTGPPMDEGMVLIYPELVAHGKIPYRDFETFYGPANPYFLAGAYQLFGTHLFTERGVGLLYRVFVITAVWGIARRWGTLAGAGGMLIAGALLICTELMASAWIPGLGCALASLWITSSASRAGPRYFFGGCLGGLALLFRPDLGPAVMLSSLPLLWGAAWRNRIHYAAGFIVALLPLAIVTLAAGIGNVWDNLFYYPVIASNPGRRLPLSSADPHVLHLLFFHLIASLIIAASALLELRKDRTSTRGLVLLSTAILALVLTPQAIQRLDFGHLFFAAVVSLPLLPIAMVNLLSRTRSAARNNVTVAAAVLTTVVLIGIVAPVLAMMVRAAYVFGLTSQQTAIFVQNNGRIFPYGSREAADTAARLFQKLQTVSKPGERLFVGPADLRRTNYCDTYIYHLFPQLRPASYFLEMNPFSANRPHSRLAADVSSADWLVLDRLMDQWNEPNRSAEFGDDAPNLVVLKKFELVGDFGPYGLFKRKSVSETPD
jgi:hypothetical protein